jgi:MFS family permease
MKLVFEKKNGKLACLAWSAAVIFYLYEYLVRVAPSVMERELAEKFSASSATMAMALGAYYFVYSPLQLFAGMLFDRFGGKKVLLPAAILVILGCLIPIIPSNSLAFITAGRVLAGVGSSCAFIGVMYLAAIWFHDNRLSFLSGLATSLGIVGALLGQAPLSFIVTHTGWKTSLLAMAVIGIAVAIIIYTWVPDTPRWEVEKRSAMANATSLKSFLSGLVSVCGNGQTWIIGLVGACLYAPLVIFGDLWGVRYIEHALGLPTSEAAKISCMLYIGWLVGSPIVGVVSDIVRCKRKLLICGAFASTVLFTSVLLLPITSPSTIGLLLFLAGVCSSPEVICFVASLEVNAQQAKGSAIAVVNMIVMFVGGIFQPIVGWLMEIGHGNAPGHVVSYEAFRNALMTMPVLTLVGLLIALRMKKEDSVKF